MKDKSILTYVLIAAASLFFLYFFIFGYSGIIPRLALKHQCDRLHAQVVQIDGENQALRLMKTRLKEKDKRIIRVLAYRLGYLDPNDKVLKFAENYTRPPADSSGQQAVAFTGPKKISPLRPTIIVLSVILVALAFFFLRPSLGNMKQSSKKQSPLKQRPLLKPISPADFFKKVFHVNVKKSPYKNNKTITASVKKVRILPVQNMHGNNI